MKFPNFSFRTILGAIISLMGVLALMLALLSGTIHRDLVLNNQSSMMKEMIGIGVKERLKDLNQVSHDLGLALQSSLDFKNALNNKNYEKLTDLLNNQFHQYFVTAGIINLEQLVLLNRKSSFVLEATDGTVSFQNKITAICPDLFNSARDRKGAQRMKVIHDLCLYNNKPINVVKVPVGGLRLKGYLLVVTDPTHNLSGLENDLGMPVRLLKKNDKNLYQSSLWPEDEKSSLISKYIVNSNMGKNILTINVAQNIEELSESLFDARLKVFFVTGLITLIIVIISILIVRHTMLNPLTKFTERLRDFNANQPRIIDNSNLSGTKEIHEICEGFNDMANAQYKAQEADQQKSMFLANMSHEIRTPLTAIIGFSEKLYKDGKTDDWEPLLKRVILNGKHLYQLINDILDKSKIEANQLTVEKIDVSVASMIYEIDSLIGEKAVTKGIDFEVLIDFPIPDTIISDPTRLKQVLINLCGNAIKFTDKGGVILRVSYYRDNIIFSIDDTGVGIKPEKLAMLFEPFTQADDSTTRKFGGTGLGLYISKQLVDKLDGEIKVSSTLNKGSHFEITLPVGKTAERWLTSKEEVLVQDVSNEIEVPKLKGRILLAEDSEDNQKLVSLLIEETGASVEVVCNGAQAIEKGKSGEFDIILMDMQMPELDGIEAVKKLRELNCTTPIAMLTANAMKDDIVLSTEAGASEFLTKPINLSKFYSVLIKHLQPENVDKQGAVDSVIITERFAKLVDTFINRLPDVINELESLIKENEWEEIENNIHKLKGTGGAFGFQKITDQCMLVEEKIRENDLDEAKKLLYALNDINKDIFTKHNSKSA